MEGQACRAVGLGFKASIGFRDEAVVEFGSCKMLFWGFLIVIIP